MSRYTRNKLIKGGRGISTNNVIPVLRAARDSGFLETYTITLVEGARLDQLAARFLGDGSLWWVIAALSGIGWNLQVPAGTKITIPNSLQQVFILTG